MPQAKKRKLRCNFWNAALQKLHCNIGFSAVRSGCNFNQKLRCNERKTALQHRKSRIAGGHLKPVTLKPVIRIFRIFRVFVSAFSAFSAFSPCFRSAESPQTLVFLGWEGRPHFRHFPCIGFESLISKIRPTGFRMTGLRWPGVAGKWRFPAAFVGISSPHV